jgi:uncharacterized membrane protein (UPF0127 family)
MIAVPTRLRSSQILRRRAAAWCCVVALSCAGLALAQDAPLEDLAEFPSGTLTISEGGKGKKVKHTLTVWLADTPQRQAQGLMFVRSLPAERGMLFVHAEPRPISMWMKNTYIPLDMVFIDSSGRIQQIVEQTTPHSFDLIRSNAPARAVLEIAGGEAKRLGLHAGQQVNHPALEAR